MLTKDGAESKTLTFEDTRTRVKENLIVMNNFWKSLKGSVMKMFMHTKTKSKEIQKPFGSWSREPGDHITKASWSSSRAYSLWIDLIFGNLCKSLLTLTMGACSISSRMCTKGTNASLRYRFKSHPKMVLKIAPKHQVQWFNCKR